MTLSDRLRTGGVEDSAIEAEVSVDTHTETDLFDEPALASDPFLKLKERAQEALFGRLGARLYDASMPEPQLHAFVLQELNDRCFSPRGAVARWRSRAFVAARRHGETDEGQDRRPR